MRNRDNLVSKFVVALSVREREREREILRGFRSMIFVREFKWFLAKLMMRFIISKHHHENTMRLSNIIEYKYSKPHFITVQVTQPFIFGLMDPRVTEVTLNII